MVEHYKPRPKYPGGWRAAWGAVAFVVGFVLTYLWVVTGSESVLSRVIVSGQFSEPVALSETVQGGSVAGWRLAEGFYLGGHFVTTIFTLDSGMHVSVNLATNAGGQYLGLLAVPPILLGVAGYMSVRNATSPYDLGFDVFGGRTWQRYAVNAGLITTFGYAPMLLLALFLTFRTPQPNIVTGWVIAGMLYPLLFGGIGGVVAYYRDDEYESHSTRLSGSGSSDWPP